MNPANIYISRWCGAKRCEVSLRIYEVLRSKGLNGKELAERVGVTRQSVSQVINGTSHSPRVLGALRDVGVPEKYLFDPRLVGDEQNKVKAVA